MATASGTREYQGVHVPEAGTYAIDPGHTTIEFVGRHLMITKVRGRFTEFTGQIAIAEDAEASTVEVSIGTASVDTSDAKRDEHLRSADFLDVETFPAISFRSTKVDLGKGGAGRVTGDLTIKGVSRPVTLDVEFDGAQADPWGGQRLGFSGHTDIDREDWDLTWNVALETGGVLVGKKIRLELNVEAVRQ